MGNLRYIKDLFIKYKYRYLSGILCLIAVDTLQLILPKVLGNVTDLLKAGLLTKPLLLNYSAVIIGIAVGIAVFRFFGRYLVIGVSKIIEAELRNRFYSHLQKLSVNYYNLHKTGDLMAHATNDINNVATATGLGIVLSIDSALIPVVALIMMLSTAGVKLTLASFCPLILLALIIGLFMKQMQIRLQKMQESISQLTETARENFSGIRVVKSFVQELKEIKKFEKSDLYNKQMNMRFVNLMSMLFPTVMSISALSFAIALWYGGILVINRQITLGDFVAFNGYLGMLI